ncbi:reverse transcriptase domain-containing protein [Tanacetum coccineum]
MVTSPRDGPDGPRYIWGLFCLSGASPSGEECGFDSKEDKVVPKVDDVSLVDRVFDGAFGGDGDEDFIIGESVVVSSSSWVKSTKSFLGGMMDSMFGGFERTFGKLFESELTKWVGEGVLARENPFEFFSLVERSKEGTIETWDELQTAFISRFFPPALFDRLLGEIHAFSQLENESLIDAWIHMKEMLQNYHGHNLSKGNIIKIFYHGLNEITQEVLNAAAGGIFLYKTPNQAYQLLKEKVLLKLDWAKNQKTKSSLKKTVAFADKRSCNSDTDKIMARMDAVTIKIDVQYKERQSHAKKPMPDLDDDDIPMSREEEAKFMQTFCNTCFYNDYRDRDSNQDNWRSSRQNNYNRDNSRSNTDDKSYDLQKQFNNFMKSQQSTNTFVKETFMDLKTQLETIAKNHQASIQNLETKFDRLADKQVGRPSGSLPSNTQPNP